MLEHLVVSELGKLIRPERLCEVVVHPTSQVAVRVLYQVVEEHASLGYLRFDGSGQLLSSTESLTGLLSTKCSLGSTSGCIKQVQEGVDGCLHPCDRATVA